MNNTKLSGVGTTTFFVCVTTAFLGGVFFGAAANRQATIKRLKLAVDVATSDIDEENAELLVGFIQKIREAL